jgi:hypothetical protein
MEAAAAVVRGHVQGGDLGAFVEEIQALGAAGAGEHLRVTEVPAI